jgi:hypothetical protein
VGKREGKRPLGRPRRRWDDNIKMDLKEVEWIDLAQDWDRWRSLVNAVMNPKGSIKMRRVPSLGGNHLASQEGRADNWIFFSP